MSIMRLDGHAIAARAAQLVVTCAAVAMPQNGVSVAIVHRAHNNCDGHSKCKGTNRCKGKSS